MSTKNLNTIEDCISFLENQPQVVLSTKNLGTCLETIKELAMKEDIKPESVKKITDEFIKILRNSALMVNFEKTELKILDTMLLFAEKNGSPVIESLCVKDNLDVLLTRFGPNFAKVFKILAVLTDTVNKEEKLFFLLQEAFKQNLNPRNIFQGKLKENVKSYLLLEYLKFVQVLSQKINCAKIERTLKDNQIDFNKVLAFDFQTIKTKDNLSKLEKLFEVANVTDKVTENTVTVNEPKTVTNDLSKTEDITPKEELDEKVTTTMTEQPRSGKCLWIWISTAAIAALSTVAAIYYEEIESLLVEKQIEKPWYEFW